MKAGIFAALALAGAMVGLTKSASATVIGADDTASSPYADGWQSGDNGGTGFGSWSLVTGDGSNGSAGFFLQDSTTLAGNSGANINSTAGTSFGLYGTGSDEADAFRSLSVPLAVGDTLSIDLAVNYRNGFKGIDLRSTTSGNNAVFNFNIGGDDYVVNDAATNDGSIGNAFSTDTAFDVSFTQTSLAGGTWNIARSGGVTDNDSGTYTGIASSIKLYNSGTDGGDPNNLFANNLSITAPTAVPEPTSLGVLALGGLAALKRRHRTVEVVK